MRSGFILVFITTLVTYLQDVRSARILGLFPHTGRSHQMVFEPLLQKLAEKGHRVTVVSHFPLKNPPTNYTDISLQGISKIGIETFDLTFYENVNKYYGVFGQPVERTIKQIIEFQPLADMAVYACSKLVYWQPLLETLSQEYDVVVMENFNSDCMFGLLHIFGNRAPIVSLSSTIMLPWLYERIGLVANPAYIHACSLSFGDKMTYFQRVENTFMTFFLQFWFRYAVQSKEQAIIEKRFGRKIPDLRDLSRNNSLMITNTYHSLQGNIPSVSGLVECGGMHLYQPKKSIPQYIEKFINESEHGVILFSFGSLIKTSSMPKYKEEMFFNVLSKLKQRVLWKYEDSGEEGTLMGNILKVKWIPQYELLQHPKVIAFIAHGGLLGMTEALSAGKPMVVVPFFGDQPTNGGFAEKMGFGKVVSYLYLTEESFDEAVQKVLSPEMRLAARRASAIWRDKPEDPLDKAVYSIERVIRWGGLDPLHLPARDLYLYEYLLLDVAAAFIVFICIVIVIILFLLRLVFKLLSSIFARKQKSKHE